MVVFNSYVKLPEGSVDRPLDWEKPLASPQRWTWIPPDSAECCPWRKQNFFGTHRGWKSVKIGDIKSWESNRIIPIRIDIWYDLILIWEHGWKWGYVRYLSSRIWLNIVVYLKIKAVIQWNNAKNGHERTHRFWGTLFSDKSQKRSAVKV